MACRLIPCRLPLVELGPGGCQIGFGKMMMAMTTTAKFSDAPVRHDLDGMSGGHIGLRPSLWICPTYLLVAPLVSGKVCIEGGDDAALVGLPGGSGSPLLHTDAIPVVVAPPWTLL